MIYIRDGSVILNLAYDDEIVQEDNSTYQLSFKFPTSEDAWKLLKEEVVLAADDLHGEQYFSIFEFERHQGFIQVYANQITSLLNHYSISSIDVHSSSGATVMSALAGAIIRDHPFSFYSDITSLHTLNLSHKSVMEVLSKDKHSIIGQWGGDLVRDKYQVNLLKNGGSENESLFMYKKNLSSFKGNSSTKSLKTRIHFHKTIEGKKEGEGKQELHVTVDSPLIGKYRNIYEADVEVSDQDVTDVASLQKYGKQYYSTSLCDVAEDSIELGVVGQADVPVRMFDVVSVYYEQFDIDLRLKISKYRYSPMSKKLKTIGFGAVSRSLATVISDKVSDSIEETGTRIADDFEKKLEKEITNANRVFDKKEERLREEITDGIEQAKAKAEVNKAEIAAQINTKIDASKSELATRLSQDFNASLEREKSNFDVKVNQVKSSVDTVRTDIARQQASFQATVADLNQAKRELATVKEAQATFKQTTEQNYAQLTNRVNGKVDTSEFNQTTSQINARVASLQTGLNDKISVSQFNVRAGQIESSVQALNGAKADKTLVTQTEDRLRERIESMQVGGRNLLRGTRDWTTDSWHIGSGWSVEPEEYQGLKVHSTTKGWNGSHQNVFVESGEYVTLSWYAKATNPINVLISALWSGSSKYVAPSATIEGDNNTYQDIGQEWKRYSRTIKIVKDGSIQFRVEHRGNLPNGGKFYICGFKLERGNIATDWSPAPEDGETQLTNFINETTRTAQETRQQITSLQQSDEVNLRKLNTVVETAEGLTKRIESMKVGGVNLLRGSKRDFMPNKSPGNFDNNILYQNETRIELIQGKQYIITAKTNGQFSENHYPTIESDRVVLWLMDKAVSRYQIVSDSKTGTTGTKFTWNNPSGTYHLRVNTYKKQPIYKVWDVQVESGTIATDYSPAPEDNENFVIQKIADYKQTVDQNYAHLQSEVNGKVASSVFDQRVNEIRQSVTSLSNDALKKAEVTIGDGVVSFGAGKTINGNIISSMLVAQPDSIHAITKLFRITGDMIVDGTVTGRDIAANTITTAELKSGAVTTEILASNAVTAEKLQVDSALIHKLTVDDALIRSLTAKQAFITSVQSVDISGTRVKGGLLASRNGATHFNLDTGQFDFYHNAPSINFNSDNAAIRRVKSGLPNQFIKFTSAYITGGEAGCTVIGSNRGGNEDANNDKFVGLRIWNNYNIDKIEVIGDTVRLASSPSTNADGWVFNTLPNQMKIYPYRSSDYPSSQLTIGDVYLYTSSSQGHSLLGTLRSIRHTLEHLFNHTGLNRRYLEVSSI